MKKIKREFKKMNEIISFLKTIEVKNIEVKKELEQIIENIEKIVGVPYAEISNYQWIGNDYKKEFYFSDIHLSFNSYNESFNANIRVKNNNIRLIVLIDCFKYEYNYDLGHEADEKATIKMAYYD